MVPARTISIQAAPRNAGRPVLDVARKEAVQEPHAWVVRLEGHEFVHGGEHALYFDTAEDAAQFAADLRLEYGPETSVEVMGLDALGLPLPEVLEVPATAETLDDLLNEVEVIRPSIRHPLDLLQSQVCRALFMDAPAHDKVDLIVTLYKPYLLPRRQADLRRLEPAFVVARLKRQLQAEFVQFAEWEAAFNKARRRAG